MDSLEKKIEAYLNEKKVRYVSEVRRRPNSDVILLSVSETLLGKTATKSTTSRRQLLALGKSIQSKLGVQVKFLITQGLVQEEIEAGLNALITIKFPGISKSCYFSALGKGIVDVWLDGAAPQSKAIINGVEAACKEYLKPFGFTPKTVHWLHTDAYLPSQTAILKELKIASPASPAELIQQLQSQDFQMPSVAWLASRLDSLRRQRQITRRKDGRYILNDIALALVPHGKGAHSSDISRALELARKKW